MSSHNFTRIYANVISEESPIVHQIDLNGETIGYTSENRDWNKSDKPVSVVSVDGIHLKDFCCIPHATAYLAEKKTGLFFGEIEVMTEVETRPIEVSSDFIDALLFAFEMNMKEKRPH